MHAYRRLAYATGLVLAVSVGGPRTLIAGAWIFWLELARASVVARWLEGIP